MVNSSFLLPVLNLLSLIEILKYYLSCVTYPKKNFTTQTMAMRFQIADSKTTLLCLNDFGIVTWMTMKGAHDPCDQKPCGVEI